MTMNSNSNKSSSILLKNSKLKNIYDRSYGEILRNINYKRCSVRTQFKLTDVLYLNDDVFISNKSTSYSEISNISDNYDKIYGEILRQIKDKRCSERTQFKLTDVST